MDIGDRFWAYVTQHALFAAGDRVLLGVSGGRDSMLMLTLFHRRQVPIEVAHCNFQLRGAESEADEQLVRAYCAARNIPLHVKRFATEKYADEQKISIQMAARELRYEWFELLATQHDCAAIAIAQHQNDHVETVLINLARGTGLAGLQGIRPKRGRIIRPLLFLNAQEVTAAVKDMQIPYRDDSSNFSTKYVRNKVRRDIIPQFEQIQPDFVQTMIENIQRFEEAQHVLQGLIDRRRGEIFRPQGSDRWAIDKAEFEALDEATRYYLFEPYGFSKDVLNDVQRSLNHEPGRVFESATHHILLDRATLLLQRKQANDRLTVELHQEDTSVHWHQTTLHATVSPRAEIVTDSNIALLDAALLVYPLLIRSWREGDYFQPLGMHGRKKLSDFFIQKKINRFDKHRVPLVVNGNGDILWVVGYQIDDRYKITDNTQKVLTLVCQK